MIGIGFLVAVVGWIVWRAVARSLTAEQAWLMARGHWAFTPKQGAIAIIGGLMTFGGAASVVLGFALWLWRVAP